ncbi:hypothetical protein [Roseobacter weihaiensis]|uniref:hypothetical protein n=1 Tax=Roseobacter weihaiensis TaxID=2763262 RepID=UPI001D0A6FF9|nr:hypothetical protein [Roseobacter sp. H9]
MRTFLLASAASLLAASSALAHDGLHHVFAGCVGRLSAEMEHAWLVGSAEADAFGDQRLVFLSLLEATTPPEHARTTLNYRIEVKMAHASLLTQATFQGDTPQARAAGNMAFAHLSACQRLLLDT